MGTQGIIRDITEHKKLESQLLQAKKLEVVGNLAAGIAHDLNNILSGLVSYPDLLLMDLPADSPLREKIVTIQKSGEKAAVIVQDRLTLARRGVQASEIVDLNEIISAYLASPEFANTQNRHSGTIVETHCAPDLMVLDMVMPQGMDGLETYRRVISMHPNQRAIIASGYSESERVKALQKLGAGAYIQKPYTLQKIGVAVRAELDRPFS
jgi:CheY-like chemotaxis protein